MGEGCGELRKGNGGGEDGSIVGIVILCPDLIYIINMFDCAVGLTIL